MINDREMPGPGNTPLVYRGWEDIYKELRVVQREIMPCVEKFTNLLLAEDQDSFVLLDSGCGTGRHSISVVENLASQNRGVHLEAFDISEEAIKILGEVVEKTKILNNKNASINIFNQSLDVDLPYEDKHFDGIISTLVVEHGLMEQIIKWCAEMDRVLRKGGLLAFSVPSREDPRYLTGEDVEPGTKINTNQKDGYLPHHFFTDQEIENLFRNFEIVYKKLQIRPSVTADVEAKHWEYVFRKK